MLENYNCYKKKSAIIIFMFIMPLSICFGNEPFSDVGKEEHWRRYYQIFRENKLPLFENEEEVLQNVEKILKEDKSVFSACVYLAKKVGDYENGYLLYSNQRIKEKLNELMKIRMQCALKRSIYRAKKGIDPSILNTLQEEDRNAYVKKFNEEKSHIRILEEQLEELVAKDGDMCPECYLEDPIEEKARKEGSDMDEGKPGDYSWNVAIFYSIALSCFSGDIYDYLWVGSDSWLYGRLIESDFSYLRDTFALGISFATIYAKQFLEDIEKGWYEYGKIYRKEGECLTAEEILKILDIMISFNSEFVEKEKKKIKDILLNYLNQMIDFNISKRKEKDILLAKSEKGEDVINELIILENTYLDELRLRKRILNIYERIGNSEDIKNIKMLAERIDLDYPIRKTTQNYDEKNKEEYLKKVKDLQDRVNALVEKLSRQ